MNVDDIKNWGSFWGIYGIITIFEMLFGFILGNIPFYRLIRLGFFVFLLDPQTNGAQVLYTSVIAPRMNTHKKEIQILIENVESPAKELRKEA